MQPVCIILPSVDFVRSYADVAQLSQFQENTSRDQSRAR